MVRSVTKVNFSNINTLPPRKTVSGVQSMPHYYNANWPYRLNVAFIRFDHLHLFRDTEVVLSLVL